MRWGGVVARANLGWARGVLVEEAGEVRGGEEQEEQEGQEEQEEGEDEAAQDEAKTKAEE